MAVDHKAIADAERHEPKGASTAAINSGYFSNGAGSGTWTKVKNVNLDGVGASVGAGYFIVANGSGGFSAAPAAHGSVYFSNFITPYTLAATTSYQKIAPTTVASGEPVVMTEGTDCKLTYIGTGPIHLDLVWQASFDQSTGSNKDVYVALYKNGALVPGSEVALTTVSANKVASSVHKDVHATAGDYFEIYCKISAAASVNFYSLNLMASTAGL